MAIEENSSSTQSEIPFGATLRRVFPLYLISPCLMLFLVILASQTKQVTETAIFGLTAISMILPLPLGIYLGVQHQKKYGWISKIIASIFFIFLSYVIEIVLMFAGCASLYFIRPSTL